MMLTGGAVFLVWGYLFFPLKFLSFLHRKLDYSLNQISWQATRNRLRDKVLQKITLLEQAVRESDWVNFRRRRNSFVRRIQALYLSAVRGPDGPLRAKDWLKIGEETLSLRQTDPVTNPNKIRSTLQNLRQQIVAQ